MEKNFKYVALKPKPWRDKYKENVAAYVPKIWRILMCGCGAVKLV